jgi:hypothetical protein
MSGWVESVPSSTWVGIRLAGGLGETGYMDSPLVNAFVEQVFPSSLSLLVHNEASPNTGIRDSGLETLHILRLRRVTAHLKYSFVASISPASSNTENRMPLGCVGNTWSYLQIMSRSWS